jgi:thioredoxin 1
MAGLSPWRRLLAGKDVASLSHNARLRRIFGIGIVLFASILTQSAAPAQNVNPAFAPLEQWKNAVLLGDPAGLKMLYSTSPPAEVAAPGDQNTADAEVNFWISLKARQMNIHVVQTSSPQPALEVIAFQAEVRSGEPPQTLYVTEAQVWLKQGDEWRLLSVKRTGAAHLQQPINKDKNIYPADVDARTEIKEAEEKAAKDHKRVLVVFGANWCYDCHVLDTAFERPDLAPVLAASYEVVHVDIGEGNKNQDLMKDFQVPRQKGIPALAVLESTGKLVVSQKNGEFENARAMTPEALLEFLNKWKPQAR